MKVKETPFYAMLVVILLMTSSCVVTDDSNPNQSIELPPFETMAIDFDDFMDESPSATKADNGKVGLNWLYPRVVIGVWNTALFTTLAIPVASFNAASSVSPVLLQNGVWQWAYTIDGFGGQYSARLTGQLSGNNVNWNMYISKTGVGAFDEFLWFSGASRINGTEGRWTLNQGPDHPNPILQIDWVREANEISNIRYTWVRNTDENDQPDLFNSSYLTYGKVNETLDVFYTIHAYNQKTSIFDDVFIEWSSSKFNGRVKSASYFSDQEWHCWNGVGDNTVCE